MPIEKFGWRFLHRRKIRKTSMKNWNYWIFPRPNHNPAIYWAITWPSFNNPYMNQSNEGTPPPLITFKIRFPSLNHLDDLCFTAWTSTFWDICGMKGKRYGKKGGCVFFLPGGCNVSRLLFQKSMWKGCPSWERWSRILESTRSFQKSSKSSWDRVINEKCIDVLLYCCHSIPQTTSNLFPACFCNAFHRPEGLRL